MEAIWRSRRGRRATLGLAIVLAGLGGWRATARAAEDPESLISQGVALRKAGEDLRAQGYFQRAYDIAKTPRSAAQLGLVEFALKLFPEAEDHVTEALRAKSDLWIAKNKDALQTALVGIRKHLGRLDITGEPAGARVSVADVVRGELPLPEPVYASPGAVVVSLSASGYVSLLRSVNVEAGQSVKVDIRLVAVPAPATVLPVPVQPPPPPSEAPRASLRQAAWGVGIGAVVLLGAGGVALAESNHNYTQFNNQLVPGSMTEHQCAKQAPNHGGGACGDLLSSGDRDKTLAIVGFALGGAAAVGSAVLFATSSGEGHAASAGAVACAPELQTLPGATCAVRF